MNLDYIVESTYIPKGPLKFSARVCRLSFENCLKRLRSQIASSFPFTMPKAVKAMKAMKATKKAAAPAAAMKVVNEL